MGAQPPTEKVYYLFQAHREEFMAVYHKRSNVESAFSAIKRKFGEHVRSPDISGTGQRDSGEASLLQPYVVVHEMFENGIAPDFVNRNSKV